MMVNLLLNLRLPSILRHDQHTMSCAGCVNGHMQLAAHKSHTERPPPGHTVVEDIVEPLKKRLTGSVPSHGHVATHKAQAVQSPKTQKRN